MRLQVDRDLMVKLRLAAGLTQPGVAADAGEVIISSPAAVSVGMIYVGRSGSSGQ